MIRFINAILSRLRRPRTTTTPPVTPMQSPTVSPQDVTDGVLNRRTFTIDGISVPTVARESRQMTVEGLVLEEDQIGGAVLGDGSLVTGAPRAGYTRCLLCWHDRVRAVEARECSPDAAYLQSLCANDLIKRSDISGIPLCPAHAREIDVDGKRITVSTAEAEQIELQESLQRPIAAIFGLFITKP